MKKILSFLVLFISFVQSTQAQSWSKLGIGSAGLNMGGEGIYSICSDNHSNIYAAGWLYDTSFHQIVAKWDGTSWTRLGAGSIILDSLLDITQILADTSGNVYAVGQINNSVTQYVAKWDGTTWSKLGVGSSELNANSQIIAICMDRFGNLYAAGVFMDTLSDTIPRTCVKKWDGSSWSELGTGVHALNGNNAINTLCTDAAGNVYAAGVFTDSTSAFSGNIYVAKWDGTSWSELGSGLAHQYLGDYQIFSILVDTSGNIYAGGNFPPYKVMKWDGSSWNPVGITSGIFSYYYSVNSLCFDLYGNLYAGGTIQDTATGNRFVAKWDGTAWSELGIGSGALNANQDIQSICSDASGNIYAGGIFTDTTTSVLLGTTYIHPFYVAQYTNPATGITPIHSQPRNITVYPNPANSNINIYIGTEIAGPVGSNYSLLDYTGRIYRTGMLENKNTMVDIKDIPEGLYLLKIENGTTVNYYKIIKL